jgi:hypothetical protein
LLASKFYTIFKVAFNLDSIIAFITENGRFVLW